MRVAMISAAICSALNLTISRLKYSVELFSLLSQLDTLNLWVGLLI
jgi:hypothetical protein